MRPAQERKPFIVNETDQRWLFLMIFKELFSVFIELILQIIIKLIIIANNRSVLGKLVY
jgi:hypothetical protein